MTIIHSKYLKVKSLLILSMRLKMINIINYEFFENMLLADFFELNENQMADILFARELIHTAMREKEKKPQYFDFLASLRKQFGKEYSTQVHHKAVEILEQEIKESN